MSWRRKKTILDEPPKEPLFTNLRQDDEEMTRAQARAAATIDEFVQKWHKPGKLLLVERGQVFDWFVNDDGLMHGRFTLRIARSRRPEGERAADHSGTGVRQWLDTSRS